MNPISGAMNPNADPDVILEVSNLRKYHDIHHSLITRMISGKKDVKVKAVDGVDLKIKRKQIIGLVGESGCGKSTLGKTIVGLHKATEGKIIFHGTKCRVFQRGYERLSSKVQMIFQNPYACLNPRKTVRDIVSDPLKLRYKISSPAEREEIVGNCMQGRVEPSGGQSLPPISSRRTAAEDRNRQGDRHAAGIHCGG